MQRIIVLIFAVVLLSCSKKQSEKNLLNKKNPAGNYGELITLSRFNTFKDLFDNPQHFIGQKVLVKGKITEVCPMRGCWINVKDNNFQIRVKVTDGKIVFPLSAVGHSVSVEGVFSKLNFSKKQAIQWKMHLAEEKGEILNPDSIIIKESDLVEYRIIGNGAIIYSL